MRDFDLHIATTSGQLAGEGLFLRLLRNWRAKRSVVRLQDFDDHLLLDMGVTRHDVEVAARAPLSVNAIAELRMLRQERHLSRTPTSTANPALRAGSHPLPQ